MISGFSRTAALLAAMLLGVLVPQAQALSGAIRWLVMAMLFIVFLQTRFSRHAVHRSHAILLAVNITIGFAAWAIGGAIGGRDVALAAFFAGITPTAAAAPVIISFLRGRVEYVVASFLITNVIIAALCPIFLPLVMGETTPALFANVMRSVGIVVFVPLAAAWIVRRLHPAAAEWPRRLRTVSFGMWVAALFLVAANASAFLRHQVHAPARIIVQIAAITLAICAVNFALGYIVGGREFRREGSQSLGQKNTTFTIYLALAYASPLIALGPTCYVLWHNVWNSWQLHRMGRRERLTATAGPPL